MNLLEIQTPNYYADEIKPKPYFRGKLHCILVYTYIPLIAVLQIHNFNLLSLGLGLKSITYSASAVYHVYPFNTVYNLERAFWCDIFFVPFSIIGNIIPIIEKNIQTHLIIMIIVIIINGCSIRTHEITINTFKSKNRKDIIRGLILVSYSLWVLKCLGNVMCWDIWWYILIILSLLSLILWIPVSNSYSREPLNQYIPWHISEIWGYHEDFHVVLACIDIIWFLRMYILLK